MIPRAGQRLRQFGQSINNGVARARAAIPQSVTTRVLEFDINRSSLPTGKTVAKVVGAGVLLYGLSQSGTSVEYKTKTHRHYEGRTVAATPYTDIIVSRHLFGFPVGQEIEGTIDGEYNECKRPKKNTKVVVHKISTVDFFDDTSRRYRPKEDKLKIPFGKVTSLMGPFTKEELDDNDMFSCSRYY
jgi:hypothetical protein